MEEKKNDESKTTNVENKNTPRVENTVTIMPTMIDDSEERKEKRRDLSAIIPQFSEENESSSEGTISIESKEKELKGDGAVQIGTINNEGDITLRENAQFPEQIDLEERIEEAKKKQNKKTKKEKKKVNKKAEQAFLNKSSLMSLIVIIFLVGVFYYIKTKPTEKDFKPLYIVVELGEALPKLPENYVKPGVGKNVGLDYAIDTSSVKLEVVGKYTFTVKHAGLSKTGTIEIKDSKRPELIVRQVTITENQKYTADSFVESCKDLSGCNYSFEDKTTEQKYTSAGSYTVRVVATDAYNNSVVMPASLVIEEMGNKVIFVKEEMPDFEKGYKLRDEYELHLKNSGDDSFIVRGIHKTYRIYNNDEKYKLGVKEFEGHENYDIGDANTKTITHTETVYSVGNNYSYMTDINKYFAKEGYIKQ